MLMHIGDFKYFNPEIQVDRLIISILYFESRVTQLVNEIAETYEDFQSSKSLPNWQNPTLRKELMDQCVAKSKGLIYFTVVFEIERFIFRYVKVFLVYISSCIYIIILLYHIYIVFLMINVNCLLYIFNTQAHTYIYMCMCVCVRFIVSVKYNFSLGCGIQGIFI